MRAMISAQKSDPGRQPRKSTLNKVVYSVALAVLASCTHPRNPADLDGILRRAVEQQQVPGVVAMVATSKGIVYEAAFDLKNDTIFAIASMTKPITSVAVMQLVEAGKISLDVPAATYLPELGDVKVLDGSFLRAPSCAITVRQLLTHTSGFGYDFMNARLRAYLAQNKAVNQRAAIASVFGSPLVHDPGICWEYGTSTDWLGRLVERVTGESLETYFNENILAPLGMRDSYFIVPANKQPRLAPILRRAKDGALVQEPQHPQKPVEFFSGGGGLYSTAADYLTFARTILAGGQWEGHRLLRIETVLEMGRNQIGALTLRPFSSTMPEVMADGFSLPGGPDKFGLGFAVNSSAQGSGWGTNTMSWVGIYNTFFWIDRAKGVCAVILTQMLPFADAGPFKLFNDFIQSVYGWLRPR